MAQAATNRVNPFLAWMWREEKGLANLLRFPFTVASVFYGAVIQLRIFLYEKRILSKKKVNCHVVSIGNITAGGTGKTPMTIYLAEQWQERGAKVGIVSRGYRRSNEKEVLVVSEGGKPLSGPDIVGDEPYLMAERLSGIPIAVSADRVKGCETLIRLFGVDVILLDDGFQHLKLHRDLNLLIIDATNPFGNAYLLPRGCLREPLKSMTRADYVIFTRTNDRLAMDEMVQKVRPFQKKILQSRFKATDLINVKTGASSNPSDLQGMSVMPFCGIGNPDAFLGQLEGLGAKLESPFVFEDHHDYKETDMLEIVAAAKKRGMTRMVTTEKDAVKIKRFIPDHFDVFALRIALTFKSGSDAMLSKLFER